MATLVQIGEGAELVERTAPLAPKEPREPLKSTALRVDAAFLEPKDLLNNTALFEATPPHPETHPATTSDPSIAVHLIHILLRTVVAALIAPILLVVALVVFLFALADFSWFRLRDLRNGHPHPKGLWEF